MAVMTSVLLVAFPLKTIFCESTERPFISLIFYFSYRLGRLILGKSVSDGQVTPDILWFLERINEIWWPLLTGSLVIGITLSVLGHLIVNQFWRYRIIYAWIKRREKYKAKQR